MKQNQVEEWRSFLYLMETPCSLTLALRVRVSRVLMRLGAVFVCSSGVLLGFFMLAQAMVVRRLMVVMRRRGMVGSSLMVIFVRRVRGGSH